MRVQRYTINDHIHTDILDFSSTMYHADDVYPKESLELNSVRKCHTCTNNIRQN